MRLAPATDAEVRASFERVLKGLQDGTYQTCPTAMGFTFETMEALNAIALAEKPTAVLIVAARTALAQQLNGNQNRAGTAAIARSIQEGTT